MASFKRSSNTFTFESVLRHKYRYEIVRKDVSRRPAIKTREKNVNPYLEHCTSLDRITFVFLQMIDLDMIHKKPKKVHWIADVYKLLPKYIDRYIEPDDSDIEYIARICDILLKNNLIDAYEALLLNSSEKFLTNYVNVQEKPQLLFYHLKQLGLTNLCSYLWNYIYVDNVLDFDF